MSIDKQASVGHDSQLKKKEKPMDIDTVLLETEEKMTKSIEYLQREYRGVRTGRANTALLEYVKVEYYGSNVDLREIAGISVPEPTQLLIKPFDPGSKAEIIKAIERSGLGLNPQSEGSQIRIMLPPPSSERRKQLAMQVRKMAEDCRVTIRNERRDANKSLEALENDPKSKISEDQVTSAKEYIDEVTKKTTTKIDDLTNKKVSEVEEI
ncbi:MAG: ribosome recycling factor [Planctomycetota bacterium]|nr:MAG: ribosome recycling factor [Planctomycetota bacterium]